MKTTTAVIAALIMLLSMDSFAKGGGFSGGGRSFGSSSFSRPSSSISRASTSSSSSTGFKFGSSSGSKPSGKTTLFDSFKSRNTAPTKRVVASDLSGIFNKSYRTNRRTDFYSGYSIPSYAQPIIVQHSNYGAWDAMLLWSIMDNVGDRKMYYNHMNEPSFQSWRNDANSLCAQGNQEVCTKLKDLDKEVADLKQKGVKPDPTYITEGVDASIYLADNIKAEDIGEIKICTGTMTSDYTRFANQLKDKTKLKITPVYSNGSIDNLSKMAKGDCDIAFTQADTLVTEDLVKIFTLKKPEQTLLVCNAKSGVKTVNDLTDKHTVYIGSDQTGSHFTYDRLVNSKVGSFGKNIVNDTKPVIGAANTVDENDNACLFAVDTWDAPYIKQMAATKKSKLVAFTDDVKGYSKSYIDDDNYKTLTQDKYSSWFGFWSKGTPVLSVDAVLTTTATWEQNNPVALYDVFEINKQFLTSELQ